MSDEDGGLYQVKQGTAKVNSILTVVATVYHRPVDEPTASIDSRFSRKLNTDESAYQRRTKASINWEALGLGWAKRPSLIVIQNLEAPPKSVPEGETGEPEKLLELSFRPDGPRWFIPPGQVFIGTPSVDELFIRASHDKTRYALFVVPD